MRLTCGEHRWNHFPTVADDLKVCPECGKPGEMDYTPERAIGRTDTGKDWDRILNPQSADDVLERQAAFEHRAWLEKAHDQRESGVLNVKESGPNWSRPFGNAERPRKYF